MPVRLTCTPKLASVSMPYGFNALSRGIFADCKALSSVDLSSTIIDIPESAFSGCTSLKKVDIPLSVETIGEQAFGGCTALATVNFPEVSESTEGDADNSSLENISGTAFIGTKWLADKQKTSPLVIVNKLLVNGQAASGNSSGQVWLMRFPGTNRLQMSLNPGDVNRPARVNGRLMLYEQTGPIYWISVVNIDKTVE